MKQQSMPLSWTKISGSQYFYLWSHRETLRLTSKDLDIELMPCHCRCIENIFTTKRIEKHITSTLVELSFSSITCFKIVKAFLQASFNVIDWNKKDNVIKLIKHELGSVALFTVSKLIKLVFFFENTKHHLHTQ